MSNTQRAHTGRDPLEDLLWSLAFPPHGKLPSNASASPTELAKLGEWFADPFPDNGLGQHLAQYSNVRDRLLHCACLLELLYRYLVTRPHPDGSIYSYVAGGLLKAERYHCKDHPKGPIFQPHSEPKGSCYKIFLRVRIESTGGESSDGGGEEMLISPADLDPLLAYQLLFGGFLHPVRGGKIVVEARLPITGIVPGSVVELLSWATRDRGFRLLKWLEGLNSKPSVDFPFTFLALLYLDERWASSSSPDSLRDFFDGDGIEKALQKAAGWIGKPDESPPVLRDLDNAVFVLEHLKTFMDPTPSRLGPLLEKLKEARARLQSL